MEEYDAQVEIALVSTPGEFEIISMSDVLDGTVKAEHFDDCIVLIGAYEEGMMDSYRVPIDYSTQMYGVELQANYIYGFLNDRVIYPVNGYIQFFITFLIVLLFGLYALNNRIRNVLAAFAAVIGGYFLSAVVVFKLSSHMLNILAVPLGAALVLLTTFVYKYIEMQRKRLSYISLRKIRENFTLQPCFMTSERWIFPCRLWISKPSLATEKDN